MKIPKYIDKLIERRMNLAIELQAISAQLDNWLEKNGFDLSEMSDYTISGCLIYCEPIVAAKDLRQDILNR